MLSAARMLLALAAALSWPFVACASSSGGSDAVCSAHSTAPGCRAEGRGAGMERTPVAQAKKKPQVMQDLISQEVEELEQYVKLCETRISMLEELQSIVDSGYNISLPEAHVRALQDKLPLLSEVPLDAESAPIASADDYLISKAVIPQDEAIQFVKFMPLKTPSSSSSSSAPVQSALPHALLVAAQDDGTVRLFSPSGELLLEFSSGHEHRLVQLAVSPREDESMVVTSDAAGIIRVHKVIVKQRKLTSEERKVLKRTKEEKISQFLGPQLNVSAMLHREISAQIGSDGEATQIVSLCLVSKEGAKFFVAGDTEGKISIFTKNGTLRAKMDATTMLGAGIEGLYPQMGGTVIFRAGAEWGYVDLDKFEVRHIDCPGLKGKIAAFSQDAAQPSRVLMADEDGKVWVFSVRNRKDCRLEHSFDKSTREGLVDITTVRGFTIGLERANGSAKSSWSIMAFNNSHIGKKKWEVLQAASPVVWRQLRAPVRSWAVHKRTAQQGDLIAVLSDDGLEIEILELLMSVYTAPKEDNVGNFKLPVIGMLVILVLGYQFMKQRRKSAPEKPDWDKDLADLKKKREGKRD